METARLWKVTIRYDAHHIDGTSKLAFKYLVPGINQEEALEKARDLFSEQEWKGKELVRNKEYQDEAITLDNYRESIRILHTPLPKISSSDADKFKLAPRLSKDGRNIEYIVNEK